jgi:multimeric flavodoxin WrbA
MKILILVGSYRKHGNTDQICGLIGKQLEEIAQQRGEVLEIETVYLGQQNISMCRGCRVCFNSGEYKCPLKDDLLAIKARMQAADGVVVASPVYVDDVSGILKNWIDRMAHVCHRPEFAGKCAYLVATVGSSPTSHTLQTMKLALNTWGFHIVGQSGFKTDALMKPELLRATFEGKTAAIAAKLFRAVRERRFANPYFMNLMMFKIQQLAWRKAPQATFDYQYWNGKGWTDPRTDFYIPHEASRVKVALARLTGSVLARFVS